jgi:hypothetical protein
MCWRKSEAESDKSLLWKRDCSRGRLGQKIWDSILRGTSQHLFTPKWLIMRPWKYRSESQLCIQYRSQDWKLSPHIHVKQDSSADAIKWLVYLGRLIQRLIVEKRTGRIYSEVFKRRGLRRIQSCELVGWRGILARNISRYAWRLMKDSNFPCLSTWWEIEMVVGRTKVLSWEVGQMFLRWT